MKPEITLLRPAGYDLLTPTGKLKICNGCGSLWGGILVPDTIWGLDISEACNIHDYMYHVGKNKLEKFHADDWFYRNMRILITNGSSNFFMIWIRTLRARKYLWAVKTFGDDAFYDYPIN